MVKLYNIKDPHSYANRIAYFDDKGELRYQDDRSPVPAEADISHIVLESDTQKECLRCRKKMPLSAFGMDKSKPDDLNIYCQLCLRKDANRRQEINRIEAETKTPAIFDMVQSFIKDAKEKGYPKKHRKGFAIAVTVLNLYQWEDIPEEGKRGWKAFQRQCAYVETACVCWELYKKSEIAYNPEKDAFASLEVGKRLGLKPYKKQKKIPGVKGVNQIAHSIVEGCTEGDSVV